MIWSRRWYAGPASISLSGGTSAIGLVPATAAGRAGVRHRRGVQPGRWPTAARLRDRRDAHLRRRRRQPERLLRDQGLAGTVSQHPCATGADLGIKVYGPDDPPNDAHPPGTLKMEYGNSCCAGVCGENWADPNPSATVFVDGSETCNVTMWVKPARGRLLARVQQWPVRRARREPRGEHGQRHQPPDLPPARRRQHLADRQRDREQRPGLLGADAHRHDEHHRAGARGRGDRTGLARTSSSPNVTDLAVESDGTTAYLKFAVPPIDGKITRTRLFMHSSTAPSSDGDGGEVHAVMDSAWSENTMTWNTRPALDAGLARSHRPGVGRHARLPRTRHPARRPRHRLVRGVLPADRRQRHPLLVEGGIRPPTRPISSSTT